MVLDFYRRRWIIEDYFRTLKTAGFDIEAAEIEDPNVAVLREKVPSSCEADEGAWAFDRLFTFGFAPSSSMVAKLALIRPPLRGGYLLPREERGRRGRLSFSRPFSRPSSISTCSAVRRITTARGW
jgi:hypothetical protein